MAATLALAASLAACGGEPEGAQAPPQPSSPPIEATSTPPAPDRPALLEALARTETAPERQKLLDEIGETLGAAGLVSALEFVKAEPKQRAWFEMSTIFRKLHELADPRVGDALVRWAETAPRPVHWAGEVGTRLAEIGDVRGAAYLAARMRHEPGQVYKAENFWESDQGGHLSRTDLPRVVGARMLADLAMIHPEAKDALRATAEDAVLEWATSRPQPHANALRFLAAVGSQKALKDLRLWAFPADPLPARGAQPPFPAAFETAQMALRYIGMMKDEPSFDRLVGELARKQDRKLVITQEGLQGGGIAMLGMALRAIGYGATQGLGQWGDARAVKPLMTFIEDETWHEEARLSACEALAWCADDKAIAEVVKRTGAFAKRKEPRKQLIAACYATTLATRGAQTAVPALVELLKPGLSPGVPETLARAIGAGGLDAASEAKLEAALKDPAVRTAAAIALLLGGSPAAAARVAKLMAGFDKDAREAISDAYFRAFSFWSDVDLEHGNLFRWVENAEAVAGIRIGDAEQTWARQRLAAQMENIQFDNGPRSMTRVTLLYRLLQIARRGEPAARRGAVATLALMKARGTLAALAEEPGEVGELARGRLAR